jgi:hypothetical protein
MRRFAVLVLLACSGAAVAQQPASWSELTLIPKPAVGDILRVTAGGTVEKVAPACIPTNLVRLLDAMLGGQTPPLDTSPAFTPGDNAIDPQWFYRSEAERWRDSAVAHERDAARARAWADEMERQERLRAEARQVVEQCKQ